MNSRPKAAFHWPAVGELGQRKVGFFLTGLMGSIWPAAPLTISTGFLRAPNPLTTLGTPDVRVIAPRTLLPTGVEQLGVSVHHDMREGLAGCDVVVMLRLQNERMKGALLPSPGEFFKNYGLTQEKLALAKPDAIVMHPGPMNRGVEIDSSVADGPHSVILPQVTFGIAVRMAVMSILAGN